MSPHLASMQLYAETVRTLLGPFYLAATEKTLVLLLSSMNNGNSSHCFALSYLYRAMKTYVLVILYQYRAMKTYVFSILYQYRAMKTYVFSILYQYRAT